MEILTHSAMSAFKNCRRKYQYRYLMNLVPKGRKASLSLGTAVHKGLEFYYCGSSLEDLIDAALDELQANDTLGWTDEDWSKLQIQRAICEAMLRAYVPHFNDYDKFEEIYPEIEFQFPLVNPGTGATSRTFEHAGKIDGLFLKRDGTWWLREFKTASQIGKDYIDRLKLDTQITSYMEAAQREFKVHITGIIYTILKKPSIKQKQTETVTQYCERLIQDYQDRPEFYFHQEELYRGQSDLLEWQFEKWEIAKDILEAKNTGRFYKNTSMCSQWGQCEYMPLCTQGENMLSLYREEAPHSELSFV